MNTNNNTPIVPIHLKLALTSREAAAYSKIGINRIDATLREPNCPFVLHVGEGTLPSTAFHPIH